MNDDCFKILIDNCFNIRLNDLAKSILHYRCEEERFKKEFSIIFMGDTHVDKNCEKQQIANLDIYSDLIKKAMKCKNILCIIHGGDGTNNGSEKGLVKFIDKTKEILYMNNVQKDYIPFFMNIGNHEFNNSPCSEIHYIELVGKTSQIISLKHQQLDIILLNTGCKSDGFFNKHNYFKKQLNKIEDYINSTDSHINFLIDMHIPPGIEAFEDKSTNDTTPHSLNCNFTNYFKEFMNKYYNRIIAIVTHHLHCFYQQNMSTPATYYKTIPFYLTANAGHCTSCFDNKICTNEFLKFNFELKCDLGITNLKIINVDKILL